MGSADVVCLFLLFQHMESTAFSARCGCLMIIVGPVEVWNSHELCLDFRPLVQSLPSTGPTLPPSRHHPIRQLQRFRRSLINTPFSKQCTCSLHYRCRCCSTIPEYRTHVALRRLAVKQTHIQVWTNFDAGKLVRLTLVTAVVSEC
ncbi:hypothetical protein BaRGS_00028386 [Batillaria attramentaria]|uniref:Secreted protein n=1 Tax=Batillaria attramentaria TaxID=370345 RepID=A0ABD0JZU9_9CAEN